MPDPAPPGGRAGRVSALATIAQGARAHPGPASVAAAAGLVNGATMVFGAGAVGWATDHLVVPGLTGRPVAPSAWWVSALLISGISAVRWSTIAIRGIATGRVQYAAQASTRLAVVRRYLELEPGFHRRRSPGQLLAHAVADVDATWQPMQFAYFALGMVFMLLLALGQLFWRDLGLGVIGAVLVASVLTLNIVYQRLLIPRGRAAQAARGEVAGVAHESVEGGPVIRSLDLAETEATRFSGPVTRLRDANVAMARIQALFDPLLELLPTGAVLGVLGVGARRVSAGSLTVGDLVGVVYLLLTIAIPLNVISRFLSLLPVSAAGRERVDGVLSNPCVRRFGQIQLAHPAPLEVSLRQAAVERDGQRILGPVSITIPRASITAVVGAVGAGKTTLLDIAGGQLHPTTGSVLFDGVDVRSLARGVVPSSVAVVSQQPFLFAESVRDNLTLAGHPRHARPYAEEELWRALEIAAAVEIVRSLPKGLDTVVGERGTTLSGGQRQRICLARAVLRQPRLLVLDDATSALDPRVERQVLAGLRDLVTAGGPTVLIVANRPGTIALADRVVLVEHRTVVAVGTHAELLGRASYRRIVTAYDQGPGLAEEVGRDDGYASVR